VAAETVAGIQRVAGEAAFAGAVALVVVGMMSHGLFCFLVCRDWVCRDPVGRVGMTAAGKT
jgi:hypothetical protein